MSIGNQSVSRASTSSPRGATADRRNRRHLRELCDEVLASYRVATGDDLFTESDRTSARQMMTRIAGNARRRSTR